MFIDPDDSPLSFDVFSVGFLFLTYVFNLAHDEKLMSSFRQQLSDSGFDLNNWLAGQLASTILSKSVIEGLGYMKTSNAGPWKLCGRMICKDHRKRPSIAECLEEVQGWSSSYDLSTTGFQVQQQQSLHAAFMSTVMGEETIEDDGSGRMEEECAIPVDELSKDSTSLITHFRKREPLGLILEEDTLSYSGVFVKSVVPRGQADRMKRIRPGDTLVRVGAQRVATYEKAVKLIENQPGNIISLSFERMPGSDPDVGVLDIVGGYGETKYRSTNQRIGSYTDKGRRQHNEDRVIRRAYGGTSSTVCLAGVFDGHGGDSASEFASSSFLQQLEAVYKNPELHEEGDDDGDVMKKAWGGICEQWVEGCEVDDEECGAEYDSLYGVVKGFMGSRDVPSGTTASLGLVNAEGEIFLLNCGDSRSVTYSPSGEVKMRTVDHRPDDEREVERLVNGGFERPECSAGGNARINVPFKNDVYQYGVSRSLESGKPIIEAGISNEAEVFSGQGSPGDFVISATDGFWDVFDNNNAGYYCSQLLKDKIKSLDEIAAALGTEAIRLGSTDNVSVVVILVK